MSQRRPEHLPDGVDWRTGGVEFTTFSCTFTIPELPAPTNTPATATTGVTPAFTG